MEKFISQIEYDIGKSRRNSYKILKHLNQDIRESQIYNLL